MYTTWNKYSSVLLGKFLPSLKLYILLRIKVRHNLGCGRWMTICDSTEKTVSLNQENCDCYIVVLWCVQKTHAISYLYLYPWTPATGQCVVGWSIWCQMNHRTCCLVAIIGNQWKFWSVTWWSEPLHACLWWWLWLSLMLLKVKS